MPLTSTDFQWPAKVGPTSKIVKDPKEWQDAGILVPHEMFRWYHGSIREILKKLDSQDPWRISLFCSWIETYYLDMIHHHHDSEEKIYNPAIKAKGGKLPDKVTSDHVDLMKGVDESRQYLQKLKSADQATIDKFKAFMTKFMDDMEEHLAEEEQVYPAAMRECNMTEEEETAAVTQIVQSMGLDGNKKMLPPILYVMCMWKGEDKMQEWFVGGPPPPIRMLTQNCWLSDFYQNNLAVQAGLKGDIEFVPNAPTCNLCVVM